MSLWLKFGGWFQCRLATDPDPSDEPRGVSGYVHAVAGEPDLDRIIRLQAPGTTRRSHCPEIGVSVREVFGDARGQKPHPLLGAKVDLLDSPKFEGRNHATAQDGYEAVFPLHLRVAKDKFAIQRKYDDALVYPPKTDADAGKFSALKSTGINASPGAIGEASGVFDLAPVWSQRVELLKADLAASNDAVEIAALTARIGSMTRMDPNNPTRPANAKFFGARMLYFAKLTGASSVSDPDGYLPGVPKVDAPWVTDFWFGGWDPDAVCGYMVGYLSIPVDVASTPQARELATLAGDASQRRA